MPDDDRLYQQIATLTQELKLSVQENKHLRESTERYTEEIREAIKDHENRLRSIEGKLSTLSERLTLWQIFQTSLTALATGAAVFFGKQP